MNVAIRETKYAVKDDGVKCMLRSLFQSLRSRLFARHKLRALNNALALAPVRGRHETNDIDWLRARLGLLHQGVRVLFGTRPTARTRSPARRAEKRCAPRCIEKRHQ
jgi:hypothetical protein